MQYGPVPTNIFERVAFWTGKVPIPMMDALFSIMKARGLMAAVRLGIFEAFAHGPRTAADVAVSLKLDPTSLESLLRCMVWAGYLKQTRRQFSLSKLSRRTMVSEAETPMTGFVQWNFTQWRMVERMEQLLRTGRGVDFHETMTDPDEWAWYQEAMLEVARFDAPVLATRVPVRNGARRLLDLGGSHGLLGAAICRKHPPMRSTVIELSDALEPARKLAAREGITDVVEHHAGDLRTAPLGSNNDVALLANILHHFLPEPILNVLKRVYDALVPQGTLAIWDLETPDPDSPPSEGDGAALYFRLTSTAFCYSGRQYQRWLKEAGFRRVRVVRPALYQRNVLIIGWK
jgi:trans-aconitate methyltransferase